MEPLLLARRLGLKRTLPGGRELEVLHDISLKLQAGEILAVAGESGSGKTSLARCLAGIDSPSSGEVWMNGLKLSDPKVYKRERLSICRQVQLIFQGFTAVNPDLTLRQVIAEPLRALRLCPKAELNARVQRLALDCGLNAALLNLPAGELSGGQLQRAALARALAVNPRVLIADEPTAALDVLLQAQIVNFLVSLVRTRGMSLIFITHDLHLVRCLADRAMLLLQGRVVEAAPVPELFARPLHPYTQLLLRSLPCPEPAKAHARLMSVGSIPQLDPDASLQEIYPGHWALLKNKP